MVNKRPILVTGCHRSGTTWVGNILSCAKGVAYIDEVFNVRYGLLRDDNILTHWYTYITAESAKSAQIKAIRSVLEFRKIKNKRTFLNFISSLFGNPRALLKDPIAILSSEWLAKTFNMDVVLLVRHPAAFVSSIKRLNWRFDFRNLLDQHLLMQDYLSQYKDKMSRQDMNLIEEASLLWLCIYTVASDFILRNQEWIVKRHEDISLNPLKEFSDIYQRLGLHMSYKTQRLIKHYSSPTNPIDAPEEKVHFLLRDSKRTLKRWKQKLTPKEVKVIREIVEPVSMRFYKEEDW